MILRLIVFTAKQSNDRGICFTTPIPPKNLSFDGRRHPHYHAYFQSTLFLTKFFMLLKLRIMNEKKEKTITACTMDCPDACSIVVSRTADGRVKVQGNPDNPFTSGFLATGHWSLGRSKKRGATPKR